MPLDAVPLALPLPPNPYWSTASFNSWFDPLYAEATAFRLSYPSLHSPDYLQPYVARYMLDGTVLAPLPTGWSTQEFIDWMAQLMAEALNAYYSYLFGRTPPELIPAVKARINYGVAPVAPTVLDFMTDVMPAGAALTRASAGWAHNNAGVLTSYANDVPRFQHDFTNASLGLLNEVGAVNTVRNNSMTGTVAGTPGTTPTNWTTAGTTDGVTRTVVGSGTEDGIPYIEIRYFGTPVTGAGKIFNFDSSTNPAAPAAVGQTWVASCYLRLMAGVMPAGGFNRVICGERSAAGGNNGGANGPTLNPTNAPLRQQRTSVAYTFTNPTSAFALAQLSLSVNTGEPCDFTVRIGAPSMVQNPALGSLILTTGAAAVTRAFDILNVVKPTPPGYYDVAIQRASGTLTQRGVDLTSGSGYSAVVANDQSPLQKITLALSV